MIGYLVNLYPAGSHTFIRREIAALEEQGIAVARFSIRPSGELADPADRAEAERTSVILRAGAGRLVAATLRHLLSNPRRFCRASLTSLRLARREGRLRFAHAAWLAEACVLREWLARAGCTHLHVHFATNPAAVGLLCRELGGPPWSFTVHGSEELPRLAELSVDEKLASASFAAAVSEFGVAKLREVARPGDAAKPCVIRCGLDRAHLTAPVAPLPAEPRLVCVARFSPEKGHEVLIEAARRLRDRGVSFELTLIGDGPSRGAIETQIAALGLGDHVQLCGWIPSHAIREQLDRARFSVLASHMEGLPVSLMESLAAGRPAVATAVSGIPELIRPGTSGWLVPPGDPSALADALRDALATPDELLRQMGARGRELVEELHDAAVEARKLAERFREKGEPPLSNR